MRNRMISLLLSILLFVEIPGIAFADNNSIQKLIILNDACYEGNKYYALTKNTPGQDVNNGLSLGNIEITGNLVGSNNNQKIKTYFFSSKSSVTLGLYIKDQPTAYSQKGSKFWDVESDSSKKIGDLKLGNKIGRGAIIIQKSADGKTWNDIEFERTDLFNSKTPTNRIEKIYTIKRADLNNGCYYRVILAYKTGKKEGLKKLHKWCTEIFIFHLIADDFIPPENVFSLPELPVEENGTNNGLAGSVIGNQSTVNTIAGEEVFHAAQGHGFAAEAANMQAAESAGNNVTHTGGNNVLNGPDYIITDGNGNITQIQCKYHQNATSTINSCFDSNGNFRYWASEGVPMQIEVPADQYDSALALMKKRISEGHVGEIRDPEQAQTIIREGAVTYKQAVNIAKAGTIESLKFDATNSIVSCSSALGVSATIRFATSIWAHEDIKTALKNSIYTGLEVGGNAFITGVLAGQLMKAGLNSAMVPLSDAIIDFVGPKAAAVIVNAGRIGTAPIYGAAAMKSASKLLRGNIVTGTITLVIFTVPDIYNYFRGRISGKQLIKNIAPTAVGIGGGFAGAAAGATAGAALGTIVPGVGNLIGGAIGGLAGAIGGAIAGQAGADAIADLIAEDDADEMLDILNREFQNIAEEYLVNSEEAQAVANKLQEQISANTLKDMYASRDRHTFAKNIIEPIVKQEVRKRKKITLPSEDVIAEELIATLEEINDMGLAGTAK